MLFRSHGAAIDNVPSFDEACLIVDSDIGRLFGRAAAVLTSNALNAGARTIGFAVSSSPHTITIAVTDDAGGFASGSLPGGRGLWSLENDPRVQSVDIGPVADGSCVGVTIALSDRSSHGTATAR